MFRCTLVVFLGCSRTPGSATVTVESAGPDAPLARLLHVTAERPVRVEASWAGQTVAFEELAEAQDLPLLGFRAGATVPVKVTLVEENGTRSDYDVEVVTDPLPAGMPQIDVLVNEPARVQPGYTLLVLTPGDAHGEKSSGDYIVVLDGEGEIVWYHAPVEPITDVSMLPDGNLVAQVWSLDGSRGGSLAEVDLFGREVRRWHGTTGGDGGVDDRVVAGIEGFHHEGRATPWGTFVTLTKDPLAVPDYPTSYQNPNASAATTVGADVAVEFDESGAVLHTWAMADYLDPTRIGFMSLEPSSYDDLPDWTHANAVTVDPLDDGVVLSLRNQSALVKLTREGDLVWILGDPSGWSAPQAPFLLQPTDAEMPWFYYQHDPSFSGDGRVVVFDNGVERVMPHSGDMPLPERERYTRVVEYEIDETAGTVTQTWAYDGGADGEIFSEFAGGTQYLPNGNVLACYGYVSRVGGDLMSEFGLGALTVRLVELVPGATPDPVLDLRISTPVSEAAGVLAYRAERIESLYAPFGAGAVRSVSGDPQ